MMEDLGYLTEEELKAQAEAQKRASDKREQEIAHLQKLLKQRSFRDFMWRMLSKTKVYGSSFAGEDTHTASFIEGQRSIGQFLLDELFTADDGAYTVLRREAAQAAKEEK